jgi:hypothetical protein
MDGMDARILPLLIVCIAIMAVAGCTTTPSSPVTAVPTPAVTAVETPPSTAPTPMNVMGCTVDNDCVPKECCHPTSCTNIVAKRVCNQMCTLNCQGPLDCGAGSCGCVQGQCSVVPAKVTPAATQTKSSIKLAATPQRYSPIMSSTPGIALTVDATGIDSATTEYTWTASYGQFLSWGAADYTVTQLGATATNNGEKIYWSFTDKPVSTNLPVMISVTAKDTVSGAVLGKSTATLAWDGDYAVIVQDIS